MPNNLMIGFGWLIFMLAAFHSILIHELGHALTGLRAGAKQAVIQLHGMGGVAVFPDSRFTRGKSILVTAAGPAASILLAFAFAIIRLLRGSSYRSLLTFGVFSGLFHFDYGFHQCLLVDL